MGEKRLELAPQDHVKLHEETARRFLREVLDLNAEECFLSDESYLHDFAGCGLPDEIVDKSVSLEELYAIWDAWVLDELKARYGLEYRTTSVPLLTLFHDLELYSRQQEH